MSGGKPCTGEVEDVHIMTRVLLDFIDPMNRYEIRLLWNRIISITSSHRDPPIVLDQTNSNVLLIKLTKSYYDQEDIVIYCI